MSFALKTKNFRTQIRRENLQKILKNKKEQYYWQKDVNEALSQYLETDPLHTTVPKICALKFQFIEEENLNKLVAVVKERNVKLDVSRSENIALISKIGLIDGHIVKEYFHQVTSFAEKIVFSLRGGEKGQKKSQTKTPSQTLTNDLIYLPNCLLQFWSNFFATENVQVSRSAYCTVLRAFIHWFDPKSSNYQSFNKYSLCYFLKNFFQYEAFFMALGNENFSFKQIEELYIRFRIVCLPVIMKLMEEKFFCDELVDVLVMLKNTLMVNDLHRVINEKQSNCGFFELLLDGMDNENFFINLKESQLKFFHSDRLNEEQIKTLEDLSIQTLLLKSSFSKIWNCKSKILDVMNGLLQFRNFQSNMFHSNIEQIWERLQRVYIYSSQQGDMTSEVQKTISIIFYNILLLIGQKQAQDEPHSCIIQISQQQNIEQRLRKYILQNTSNVSQMIKRTRYVFYDHVRQFISFLHSLSEFIHQKEIDQEILTQGRLIERVCEAIKENSYNQEEASSVLNVLFEFLEYLSCQGYELKKVRDQLMTIKGPEFDNLINEQQERFLDEVLGEFQI